GGEPPPRGGGGARAPGALRAPPPPARPPDIPPHRPVGPQLRQRPCPFRRPPGHPHRRLPFRARERPAGAHDGHSEGRRFQQLVLDPPATHEREHHHLPLPHLGPQVGQVPVTLDAPSARQRP